MTDPYRIDGQKLQFHPIRVAQWVSGKDSWEAAKKIYPLYVEVSPIGACNHRCTFCAVDYIGYRTVQLEKALLANRLAEMAALGVKSIMLAGEGEPLLHKNINGIVSGALASGLDVSFTTNGVLLDKLDLYGVSWVKVSINAATRETYAQIHRTAAKDFDRVVANLKDAVARKGDCTIGMQMVLLRENEQEINAFGELAADIGVDYAVIKPYSQHRFSLTHEYEWFKPAVPVGTHGLVVRQEAMKTTEIPYNKCQATPYFWCYTMASGDVYSCSAYLLDERFKLGNLREQTFKEIWEGERRHANWDYVREHLDIAECRVNCRMHSSNLYLTDLIKGIPHKNFI